jgi:hypothetical protein
MNAPVQTTTSPPIGATVFDVDRQNFLKAFGEFMRDPLVPERIRDAEFRATLSAISQIALMTDL